MKRAERRKLQRSKKKSKGVQLRKKPPAEIVGIDRTQIVPLSTEIYRAGTQTHPQIFNFIFINGGMGDYICWTIAVRHAVQFHKHVKPRIFVSDWCQDLIANLVSEYPIIEVYGRTKDFERVYKQGEPILGNIEKNQFLNATGTGLIDIGFSYYMCQNPPPEFADLTYPRLKTEAIDISHIELPENYCIMTPGATSPTRSMPASAFNELKDYVISKGLTPVFLGKAGLTATYKTNFKDDYDYTGGLDLRNKTSTVEAGKIIAGAQFIMGLDNGLLHLAACTDTPIIFGYTVASPELRRPIRQKGLIIDITVPKEELACISCQDHMRFMLGHEFTKCLYGDYKCCDLLFKEGAIEWKKAINLIIEEY